MTTTHDLKSLLEQKTGRKLKLKINDNRSTMVSVRWDTGCTTVSLHKMFLNAPKNVMDELACYIKEKSEISPLVKSYIHQGLEKVDYRGSVDPNILVTKGDVYDLEALYTKIEKRYFSTPLGLRITWFGSKVLSPNSSLVLGQYQRLLHLVRIHRVMDRKDVPQQVLEYVIYHEMVHHLHQPKMGIGGKNLIHHNEFKQREKAFIGYEEVQEWMKNERGRFFTKEKKRGWA